MKRSIGFHVPPNEVRDMKDRKHDAEVIEHFDRRANKLVRTISKRFSVCCYFYAIKPS